MGTVEQDLARYECEQALAEMREVALERETDRIRQEGRIEELFEVASPSQAVELWGLIRKVAILNAPKIDDYLGDCNEE